MKKIKSLMLSVTLFLVPFISSAQIADSSNAGPFQALLVNIIKFVNNTLIPFIIGIGFLFFVWGIFLYFIMGGSDDEKKLKGRSLMISATIGFVVIIIFFGLVNLFTSSTGLEGESIKGVPTVPVPRN
jgi:hypothetical protein